MPPDAAGAAAGPGWLARLKAGLSRSSGSLTEKIAGVVTKRRLDDATLEELEEALIAADLGVDTAAALVRAVAKDRFGKEVAEVEIREALAAAVARELEPVAQPLPHRARFRPQVVLVCGVNGTGKTTTIGKLANQAAVGAGLKVVLAACDTFRAAAVEQLEVWGRRNGVPVIRGPEGADPAGLAYDALERARAEGADLLMIDTAGRLQNKRALMDELRKVLRVLRKLDPEAPHDIVLVLDATTGQNAHNQVEVFKELVDLTGLIVTKLDGTAKGGVVVALARRFGLPIHAIGVGETVEDLRPFEAPAFARALLGLESAKGG
jgi:fused signal recognition particle receptor